MLYLLPASTGARAPGSTNLLSNWVGAMKPVLYNQTILDISFPGSHDSITYDLSTVFSGHANDIPPSLAWILHNFGSLVPTVGAFGRSQAKTQGLSITEQLESGIRFIDFEYNIRLPNHFQKTLPFIVCILCKPINQL